MIMEVLKVNRNGNSRAVNLPSKFCDKLSIKLGDFVDCTLTVKDEIIIIKHPEKGTS